MSTVVKDLGAVSAYAYAVEKGYTGTEEEYAELMASYADVGQTAVDARDAAVAAKTEAQTAATTATNKASEASTSAQTAATKATEASTSATSAATSASAAGSKASEASASATTASTKASEAAASASTASTKATEADTAKTAAQTAQTAAETAQGLAEDAQEAAETAAQSIEASAAQIATNTADIADVKRDLSNKVDKLGYHQVTPQNIDGVEITGGNLLDTAERLYSSQPGYVGNGGYVTIANDYAFIQAEDTFCSFIFPVIPGKTYTCNHSIRMYAFLTDSETTGTVPVKYNPVGTLHQRASSFTVPEGAAYVIVSWAFDVYDIEDSIISPGDTATDTVSISLPDWMKNTGFAGSRYASVSSPSMSDGNSISLPGVKNNLRKGERIIITGDITSFTEIRLRFMYSDSGDTNYILVNNTYITVKNSNVDYTAHGLTITDNFSLEYEYLDDNTATITLTSDGNSYTHTYTFSRQSVGYPMLSIISASLTNVKMSWTCKDLCKNIWVFGDSYVAHAVSRWPYYLKQQGYDKNILLDGFPGEGSVNARVSFYNLLKFGNPKFAVWCMGMNDGGDSESSPSEGWISGRDLFLSYCQANAVTPIFGTIPTVPTINHEQKNAWIRSSGYRYIDFAKAVGAASEGVWFTGMLAPDGVHPTEQGAKALYARVLLDFPEIMIDNLT